MTSQQAIHFAVEWVSAFNAHDIDAILAHYAEELTFYSPFISQLQFNASGCLTTKNELRAYLQLGLKTYPDLHFTLHTVFAGIDTLVIHYTSVNNRPASEVFQLDNEGKVHTVQCHYALPQLTN